MKTRIYAAPAVKGLNANHHNIHFNLIIQSNYCYLGMQWVFNPLTAGAAYIRVYIF